MAATTGDTSNLPTQKKRRLRLNTIEAVRKSFARVVRDYYAKEKAGRGETVRFRAVCYGLRGLVAAFATEANLEVEKRLEELEQRLDELSRRDGR